MNKSTDTEVRQSEDSRPTLRGLQASTPNDRRHQNEWRLVKEFSDADSGISIRVSSKTLEKPYATAIPLTYYSFEIVRIDHGRPQRHFPAICMVDQGKAAVAPFPIEVFATLIGQAEEWICGQRQVREDELMEKKISKERAQFERGKIAPRGLKTITKAESQAKIKIR